MHCIPASKAGVKKERPATSSRSSRRALAPAIVIEPLLCLPALYLLLSPSCPPSSQVDATRDLEDDRAKEHGDEHAGGPPTHRHAESTSAPSGGLLRASCSAVGGLRFSLPSHPFRHFGRVAADAGLPSCVGAGPRGGRLACSHGGPLPLNGLRRRPCPSSVLGACPPFVLGRPVSLRLAACTGLDQLARSLGSHSLPVPSPGPPRLSQLALAWPRSRICTPTHLCFFVFPLPLCLFFLSDFLPFFPYSFFHSCTSLCEGQSYEEQAATLPP